MIIDKVCNYVLGELGDVISNTKVMDVCIGIRYTYALVKINGEYSLGLAFTPLEDLTLHEEVPNELNIEKLPEYLSSLSMTLRVIGIALLNALSQYLISKYEKKYLHSYKYLTDTDICSLLRLDNKDRVVVVGYIGPIVNKLKGKVKYLYVLERSLSRRYDALPDILAPRVLSNADIVIITGSSLINDTLDHILNLSKNARLKVIVGATAQVLPEALFKHSDLDIIASFRISKDEGIREVMRLVRLGAGTREIYRFGVKYVVSRR